MTLKMIALCLGIWALVTALVMLRHRSARWKRVTSYAFCALAAGIGIYIAWSDSTSAWIVAIALGVGLLIAIVHYNGRQTSRGHP